jgi:hypothetical protein
VQAAEWQAQGSAQQKTAAGAAGAADHFFAVSFASHQVVKGLMAVRLEWLYAYEDPCEDQNSPVQARAFKAGCRVKAVFSLQYVHSRAVDLVT